MVCLLRRGDQLDVREDTAPRQAAQGADESSKGGSWVRRRRRSRIGSRSCSSRRSSPPPDEFREQANISDESIYDEADKDYEGFWEQQAEALDWEQKWDQVLDWSDPPNAKWFVGGKLNVAYNCVDRHVEAGNGDRVAFHWRGEEGEERDVTYADLHRDVQKFANALKDLGVEPGDVVGIFLPMIPEVVVAMLACARIGAPHNVVFGGFSVESVKERMEVSEAKVLITVDGARRKGKTADIKKDVDEEMGDLKSLEHIVVVQHAENDAPMDGRPRPLVPRAAARRPTTSARPRASTPSTRCSSSTRRARRRSRRASSTPPAAT